MKKSCPSICANCTYCEPFDPSTYYYHYANGEEVGYCGLYDGEVIYLDDEGCNDFVMMPNPRQK